jgi:pyrophosphatase PpaX
MTIKAVLFDLDGTLLDSIPGILASFHHVLSRHVPAHTYTRRDLVMKIGEPVEKQMLDFAAGNQSLAAVMVDDYRAHNRGVLPGMPLYPGVIETLKAFKARGQPVGVVTSKSAGSARISLDGRGVSPLLDLLMTTEDTVRHKPDPEPLLVAASRLGLAPKEIAYVGDSVHDIRCALGAGCLAVAALWGPFERTDLLALKPQLAAESLPELLNLADLLPG